MVEMQTIICYYCHMGGEYLIKYEDQSIMLKKAALLACLFAIILLSASCSNDGSDNQPGDNQIPVLKVYYVESASYPMAQMESTTVNYMVNYPNKCRIERTLFKEDQYEQYKSKLTTDLLTGEGPDIIFVDGETFPSIRKVMVAGVFCDLNELMEKDKEFNLSDYNKTIMDSGVYNGKRYLIPLYYDLPMLITTKGMTDGDAIQTNKLSSWDGFMEEVRKFANLDEKNAEYFLAGDLLFSDIVESCGDLFVDYDKRKTGFDSKEFIQLLEMYKEIHSIQCPADISKNRKTRLGFGPAEDYFSVFWTTRKYCSPFQLQMANSESLYFYKENLAVYPFPSFRENSCVNTIPVCFLGINSKCQNKQVAFDFIKYALSEKEQSMWESEDGTFHVTRGLPVYDKALDISLEFFYQDENLRKLSGLGIPGVGNAYRVPDRSISREQAGIIKNMADSVGSSYIIDKTILDMLDQEVQDFLNGRRTAKQTARIMDNKATLFLNE